MPIFDAMDGPVHAPLRDPVALAIGATDLIVAGTLGRWERRNGKTLAVAGRDLFTR